MRRIPTGFPKFYQGDIFYEDIPLIAYLKEDEKTWNCGNVAFFILIA